MTEQVIGKVMLTFKGNYDATKQYDFLDTVTYNGSSFICLVDGTKSAPNGVSENWQLLSQKGQDGQNGVPGQNGRDGTTPHIDASSGHWFIGSQDTGTLAQGPQGLKGDTGDTGPRGPRGLPGKDGVSPDTSTFALKSELPDLSGYAKKSDVPAMPHLSKYALKSDIPDMSTLATKTEVQAAQSTANTANKAARNDATLIKQLSKRVDGIKTPDLSNYATKNQIPTDTVTHSELSQLSDKVTQANQVKTITSGLLTDLAESNGVYHYEIDFFPDDRPTLTYGLLDVVVGTYYAKQTFTDDSGNVYVRMRGWDGNWSNWRQITQWN